MSQSSRFSGLQSLGKAAYFITLSPYFVLTALLAYAATRDVGVIILNTITTTTYRVFFLIGTPPKNSKYKKVNLG